jgi:hypothetical protein
MYETVVAQDRIEGVIMEREILCIRFPEGYVGETGFFSFLLCQFDHSGSEVYPHHCPVRSNEWSDHERRDAGAARNVKHMLTRL